MKLSTPLMAGLIAFSGSVFADQHAENTSSAPAAPAINETAQTSTESTPAAANTGTVARANFASDVQEREPIDKLNEMSNDNEKIFYFTELKDMAGQTITHRWEHNGKVVAEVPFEIGGNRWRIYSSKTLDPAWTGEWKASVVTSAGEELSANTFNYTAAAAGTTNTTDTAPADGATTTQ